MRLYFDLNTRAITLDINDRAHISTPVPISGGSREPVEVQFHRSGTPELLPGSTTLQIGVKVDGKFEGDYLTNTGTWTTPGSASGYYTAHLLTNTGTIYSALVIDSDDSNDEPEIAGAICQIDYLLNGETLPVKSQVFNVTIGNFVNQGDEADPTAAIPSFTTRIATLEAYGLSAQNTVSITGATTLTSAAFGKWHVCSGTSADYTVTLPTAAGNAGKLIGLRMSSALTKLVTVNGVPMWASEAVELYSDGSSWIAVATKRRPMVAKLEYTGSAQAVADSTVETIDFNVASENTAGMADTGAGSITIKRAGRYKIQLFVRTAGGFTANRLSAWVLFGSTTRAFDERYIGNSACVPSLFGMDELTLTAGDALTAKVFQTSGGSIDISGTFTPASFTVTEIPQW